MSNKALSWAFDAPIENVGAKFVLVALADHAGDHNGEDWVCFPSTERLMTFTAQGERTVLRHLAWLQETGWISKRKRVRRRREDSIYEFTLHRARADEEAAGEAAGTPASPANLAAGEEGPPPANLAATTCQIGNDHLPNRQNPPHPPIELNPQGTPTEPGAGAPETELEGSGERVVAAQWRRVSGLWKRVSPGRLAPKPAERAFRQVCRAWDATRVVDAAERYARQDGDVAKHGLMRLHVWLAEGRFEPWLLAGDGARAGPPAAAWPGPVEVREAALGLKDAGWVASYLDRSGWGPDEAGGGVILARTETAARELAVLVGRAGVAGVRRLVEGGA